MTAVALLITVNAAQAQPRDRKVTDEEKRQARALYDEGLRHYNVAEYPAAIEAFKSAYLLLGDPHLLFDVAQSYRLSGDCEQALRFYRTFLRESPRATETAAVEAAIAKCEHAAAPASAPTAVSPPVTPVERPPPAVAPVPAPAQGTGSPTEVSRSAVQGRENAGRSKRVAGVAVAITGALVAGTGVALGLYGRAQSNELAQHQGEWSHAEKRTEQSARRLGTTGQILTGVGATGVIAGVVLYLMGASDKRSASSLSMAVGPQGGGMSWSTSF